MKNIFKNILVGGIAVSLLASCDLNLTPTNAIVYEEGTPLFLQESDVIAFQNGVLASYRGLQYGSFTQSSDVMCDAFNATIGFGNNYGSVHRADYTFTPADSYVESMWGNHYIAIKNYNIAIANCLLVDDEDELKPAADCLEGIAKFCRASSYLTLARHFGKDYDPATAATDLCVPLVLKYDQAEKPFRATVKEVYNQIIQDLSDAEALLSEVVPGEVRAQVPTVDAVYALMARYYLDIEDYASAADYALTVIDSEAGYALASSSDAMIAEYTNDAGTEPIVQLFASVGEGAVGNTLYTSVQTGNDVPKYFGSLFVPTAKLVNAYGSGDLRLQAWFTNSMYPIFSSGNYYTEPYVFIKYLDNPALHTGNVEEGTHAAKPLMISEMYLIAAEAYAMAGEEGDATAILNELRSARKAGAVVGDIMDEVKTEWFRETVGEGLRFSCLKRWGDGIAARAPQATATGLVMTGAAYTDRVIAADSPIFCWPVPTYEIKINGNLVQNPGYAVEL